MFFLHPPHSRWNWASQRNSWRSCAHREPGRGLGGRRSRSWPQSGSKGKAASAARHSPSRLKFFLCQWCIIKGGNDNNNNKGDSLLHSTIFKVCVKIIIVTEEDSECTCFELLKDKKLCERVFEGGLTMTERELLMAGKMSKLKFYWRN